MRLVGATVVGVAAAAFALHFGIWASLSNRPVDVGIRSVFAYVSNEPVDGMVGDLTLLNVSPETDVEGRVYFFVEGGWYASSGVTLPTTSISPESFGHAGYSVVLGGDLAGSLGSCEESDVIVADGLDFSELTELQRNAVVTNLREQEENRLVTFGEAESGRGALPAAAATAAGMTYTVIEFGTLLPAGWTMSSRREAVPSGTLVESTSVEVVGYSAYAQCAYDQTLAFAAQEWGRRWEFPPITSLASVGENASNAHVLSTRRVFRFREIPGFKYNGALDYTSVSGTVLENSNGIYGLRTDVDAWGEEGAVFATSSVPASVISFEDIGYSQERELALFAAGVAVSLVAAMLVAILNTIAGLLRRSGRRSRPRVAQD